MGARLAWAWAGTAALASGAVGRWSPAWAVGLALAALILPALLRRTPRAALLSLLALAVLTAAGWEGARPPEDLSSRITGPARFRGVVADDPKLGEGRLRVTVDLDATASAEPRGAWRPLTGRVLLSVDGYAEAPPARGDAVVFRATLRPPRGFRNPGSLWYDLYLAREGIGARAHASWPGEALFAAPDPAAAPLDHVRRRLSAAIAAASPGRGGAVVRSLATGDRSGLDESLYDSFRRAGTVHLLSVSGLHLGIVILLASWLLHGLAARWGRLALALPAPVAARLGALPVVVLYALLAGLYASTSRALAMAVLVAAGGALSRRLSPLGLLGATCFVLLLFSPLSATDPGMQLSLAALFGLFYLSGALALPERATPLPDPTRWRETARAAGKAAGGALRAAAAATLMTAPLAAHHFGQGGWAGLWANPVAVPLLGFGALALGLLGVCLHPLGLSELPWAAAGTFAEWTIRFQEGISTLPSGGAGFGPFSTLSGVVGFYLVLLAWIRWRGNKSWRVAVALGAVLLAAAPLGRAAAQRWEADLTAWVYDVGAGLAVGARLPGGRWVAVDAGGFPESAFDTGEALVWPALEAAGCRRLDLAVSTHPHADHVSGLPSVVRLGRPRVLVLPGSFEGDPRYDALLVAAREVGAEIVWVRDAPVTPLGPQGGVRVLPGGSGGENDRSLLVWFEHGGERLLVAGDVERAGQEELVRRGGLEPVAALVAPHHGSAGAVEPGFFRTLAPREVLVSCGDRPGFPSRALEEEAGRLGARVWTTRREGALEVRLQKNGLQTRAAPR